jgi:hypothetical protein
MGIVGDHPESGVRFVFERPLRGGPPWVYAGDAFTPDERIPLQVTVESGGEVRVAAVQDGQDVTEIPSTLTEKVRLLFRALYRQSAEAPGGEPPRRVVRWRGEK